MTAADWAIFFIWAELLHGVFLNKVDFKICLNIKLVSWPQNPPRRYYVVFGTKTLHWWVVMEWQPHSIWATGVLSCISWFPGLHSLDITETSKHYIFKMFGELLSLSGPKDLSRVAGWRRSQQKLQRALLHQWPDGVHLLCGPASV